MTIQLQIPPRVAAGIGCDPGLRIDDAKSLREMRGSVAHQWPALAGRLWANDGGSRPQIRWFVNGIDSRYLHQMDTRLFDGDLVVVIPETLWDE